MELFVWEPKARVFVAHLGCYTGSKVELELLEMPFGLQRGLMLQLLRFAS